MPYVKHEKFSPQDLHHQKVALCLSGCLLEYYFRVDNPRYDGFYELYADKKELAQSTDSSNKLADSTVKQVLSQEDTDKIEVPENGSPCQQNSFAFAIVLDAESASLVHPPNSENS